MKLKANVNSVVQRNLSVANLPHATKTFRECWFKEVSNTAKLLEFADDNWKQATVDAILLQT